MKKWQIAVVVAALIAVGVGALFGGRAWGASGSSATANADQAAPQFMRDGTGPSGMPGGGPRNADGMVSGSIIAADASSITVETSDGSTKIILVSGSTSISLTTEGSLSDLVTGEDVVVSGTANSDGTVTAASIRLGSNLGLGGAPGVMPPSGAETPATQTTTQ